MKRRPRQTTLAFDDAFFSHLHSETERACVVLGSALLEAKLEELFRRKLRRFHDDLLDAGPIGTFSAQIRLARALDWISEDARFDLDTVRRIRNDFAHSFDHRLSFDDQSVADHCTNLRTARAYIEGYDLAAAAPNQWIGTVALEAMQAAVKPPRWRYELTIMFLSQHLDELTDQLPAYSGPDLLAEVRAVTAKTGRRNVPSVQKPPETL